MKKVIIVNGIPASGKSYISRLVSEHYGLPILSIDEIKEPFMVQFSDIIDRPFNRRLGHSAYESMFKIVGAAPENITFVMDAWFGFREKEVLANYLSLAGIEKVLEIWSQISPDLVAQRYQSRCGERIKGHPGEEYIPELIALARKAVPMRLGDTLVVDQDAGIEPEKIFSWVNNHLN
ncbi:ATP-binding protein [Enterobacter sp. CP102]|uniref:ATP-binding protein n=1 Tax=Enterobacter sp. CP102 TaxID=2976431 RepID=UPI00220AC409|nr:ATP-binding protein [Enterobacter sp. CP102]UWM63507.1 ATP-binding protein [Enterobacter sp. CP102]